MNLLVAFYPTAEVAIANYGREGIEYNRIQERMRSTMSWRHTAYILVYGNGGLVLVVSHLHENEGTAAYEGMDLSLSLDID